MWESGQVLCFCCCLHAQIICYLHWKQHAGFVFCILFRFNVFSKQNCYNHNSALYGWHTWWRRCLNDFWLVASTKISFAPKILLSASEPDKFSTCIMHATQLHADYDLQANKLAVIFILFLINKALQCFLQWTIVYTFWLFESAFKHACKATN